MNLIDEYQAPASITAHRQQLTALYDARRRRPWRRLTTLAPRRTRTPDGPTER